MEQQIIGAPIQHPQPQSPQAGGQQGPLRRDEGADLLHVGGLVQCGQPRCLRQAGNSPGLAGVLHGVQQGRVRAQSVPQPDACHAVQLGEGFQDQKIAAAQQRLCGQLRMVGQKIEETFVQNEQCPAGGAALQDAGHEVRRGELAGGVVGLAEEDEVHPVVDGGEERFRHRKIVCRLQDEALHRAADGFECGGIFGERGGGDQRPAGLFGPHQPEDEVGRAVATEDVVCGHALVQGELCPQFPAEWVRVAVCGGECRRDGLCHPLRQAQRAHVGRKVQRIPPELCPVSGPVAAVYQVFHGSSPYMNLQTASRIASPMASASRLSAYIIRLARRMSSGSMGRRGSPMVGLS